MRYTVSDFGFSAAGQQPEPITHATCLLRAAMARRNAAQYQRGGEWHTLFIKHARMWLDTARYYRPPAGKDYGSREHPWLT